MRLIDIALSIFTAFLLAIGQIGFKYAAEHMEEKLEFGARYALNPWLWGALFIYACATLLWVQVLRHAPLHLAYPWMALAYILVPWLSHQFFQTPWQIHQIAGAILIGLGIWFSVYET